jgi:hypothetical protein
MKKKYFLMILIFTVSFIIFVMSVFSEVSKLTPYDYIKEKTKYSFEELNLNSDSYTENYNLKFLVDNDILREVNSKRVFDCKNNRFESFINGEWEYYDSELKVKEYGDGYFVEPIAYNYKVLDDGFLNILDSKDLNIYEVILDILLKNDIDNLEKQEMDNGKSKIVFDINENEASILLKSGVIYNFENQYKLIDLNIEDEKSKNSFEFESIKGQVIFNKNEVIEEVKFEILSTLNSDKKDSKECKIELNTKIDNVNKSTVEKFDKNDESVKIKTNIDKYLGIWENDITEIDGDEIKRVGKMELKVTRVDDYTIHCVYEENYFDNNKDALKFEFDKSIPADTEDSYDINIDQEIMLVPEYNNENQITLNYEIKGKYMNIVLFKEFE